MKNIEEYLPRISQAKRNSVQRHLYQDEFIKTTKALREARLFLLDGSHWAGYYKLQKRTARINIMNARRRRLLRDVVVIGGAA